VVAIYYRPTIRKSETTRNDGSERKRWSALVRYSSISPFFSLTLSLLRFMCIAYPIGFSSPLRWWNHVYYTHSLSLFSFVYPINTHTSIIMVQFCDGWWCGCYHRRVPYVSGIEWHASRFDYALLLPSLRAASATKRTSVRYTLMKERRKNRTREMIILYVYGTRARTTVSATLPSH
jgi:hypothetical protein